VRRWLRRLYERGRVDTPEPSRLTVTKPSEASDEELVGRVARLPAKITTSAPFIIWIEADRGGGAPPA
jgi:hypothetical protein